MSALLSSCASDILSASLPDLDLDVSNASSAVCFPGGTEQLFNVLTIVKRNIELVPAPVAAAAVGRLRQHANVISKLA